MRGRRLVLVSLVLCPALLLFSGCSSMTLRGGNASGTTASAPTVVAVGLQNNGVAPNRVQYVQFSEAMDPSTINNQTFVVTDSGGRAVPGNVTYVASYNIAGFQPNPAPAS